MVQLLAPLEQVPSGVHSAKEGDFYTYAFGDLTIYNRYGTKYYTLTIRDLMNRRIQLLNRLTKRLHRVVRLKALNYSYYR